MPNSASFPSSSAVEQLTVNQRVTGSNPVSGATFIAESELLVLETERLNLRPLALDDEGVPWLPADRVVGNVEEERRLGIGCMVVLLRDSYEIIGQIGFQTKILESAVIDTECRPEGSFDAFGDWSEVSIPEMQQRNGSNQRQSFNTLEVDIYWFFDEQYWGNGYASEAARCMIEYGFTRLRLRRIIAANIEIENVRSVNLAKRIGMEVQTVGYAPTRVTGVIANPALK